MGLSIAYLKLTMYIDLHPLESTAGYSEVRFCFWKELVKRGHKIKVLTPLTINTENLLRDVKAGKVTKIAHLDVTWMKGIHYDPLGYCDKNDDVLICESATPNFMFDDKYTKGLQIRRACEIMNSFKGLVLLEQNDPDLPFPLYKMGGLTKYDYSVEHNPYRKFGKVGLKGISNLEEYSWGTQEEVFRNKKVVLWCKGLAIDKILNDFKGRSNYKYLYDHKLMDIEGTPTCYSHEYVKDVKFNYDPQFDCMYTGYPRNREVRFLELFTDLPQKLKLAVTGPWWKKNNQIHVNYNTKYLGQVPGFLTMPKISNNSKCVLQLGVNKARKLDWITNRHFEVVFSKSICLYDAQYKIMSKFLGEEFAVKNKEDAARKMLWIRYMSDNDRAEIWKYQWQLCKQYDVEWFVSTFEGVCHKHGVKVHVEPVKRSTSDRIVLDKDFLAEPYKYNISKLEMSERRFINEARAKRENIQGA